MFRHLSKLNILMLVLVALVLGGLIRFALNSSAATAPTIALLTYSGVPSNGGAVTADADNKKAITFRTVATDAANPKALRTQVFYKKSTDANWSRYGAGTVAVNGPDGKAAKANTITSKYSNSLGINCAMGWAVAPPDCAYYKPTTGVVGIPAFSGYAVYTPSVRLESGLYYWRARAYSATTGLYSGWSPQWSFTIKSPPPPPPAKCTDPNANNFGNNVPCTYDPIEPNTPDNQDNNDSGPTEEINVGDSENNTSDPALAEDKEAPTVPINLSGKYNPDESTIALGWDAATDNTGIAGYEIQRQEKGKAEWAQVGNVATEEFTDFEFAPDKAYIYQVRSYDNAGNFSAWSESREVVSGAFKANVTVADGGTVTDDKSLLTVEFPKDAVTEDIVIMINPVKVKGLSMPQNVKMVGGYFDLKAKNSQGVEVTNFKRQIVLKMNYSKVGTFGVSKSTLTIANSQNGKDVTLLKTSLSNTEANALTDHFSLYFLTAEKTGIWVTLLWILFWLVVAGGIGYAGYYGWQKYQEAKYKKEHSEDFIYKH